MKNPRDQDRSEAEEAIGFENNSYPNASPETRRLLAQSRGTIRKFLASDLGK